MDNKQKLGYILFGAGIMAVGITIGQFITPNIEAQSNGVFDKIVCNELFVKNPSFVETFTHLSPDTIAIVREEKMAIELIASEKHGNVVRTYNPKTGKRTVSMGSSEKVDMVSTWDRTDGESLAVVMFSTNDENGLGVSNPETGEKAVNMKSDGFVNSLSIADSKVSLKNAFSFSSIKGLGNLAICYDRQASKEKIFETKILGD